MTDEKRYIIVSELRKYFHAMITELDTPPECIYNADQTNHWYRNLPNCGYGDEANKNYFADVKEIIDKTRITLKLGTSASEKSAIWCSWETK